MLLSHDALALRMTPEGTGVVLEDRRRRQEWQLDEATRLVALPQASHQDHRLSAMAGPNPKVFRLGPGVARQLDDTTIDCQHPSPAGPVHLRWTLTRDALRVQVLADQPAAASSLALPGSFQPLASAGGCRAAVPSCQGVLHTGKGPAFFHALTGHGHGHGYTLAMYGLLAERGGLLSIAEPEDDAWLHWAKEDSGPMTLQWQQAASLGALRYPRETVLRVTDPDLTSLCKTFRRHEDQLGRTRTWAAKLAERPALAKLFGAAMIFLGYFHDQQCDYAASLRQLKELGIDRAHLCPALMYSAIASETFGARYADLRPHAALLRELGYSTSSFIYLMAGDRRPDSPATDFQRNAAGEAVLEWQIADAKWYKYSPAKRLALTHELLRTTHQGLDAVHFDVLGSTGLGEDPHATPPTDRRTDAANRRTMLQAVAQQGLMVSTEGFWGRNTDVCDLGSVKYAHVLGGEEYCTVPMTMLVYHDCALHGWWEVDNYNNFEHRSEFDRGLRERLYFGGGHARLMAAIDAIHGLPPDIMPFGWQYNYVPHNHPQIYYYRFTLDDPGVQAAIAYAKPVMALHRQVGQLALVAHHLHRPDGAVQESVFADGTRVVANFAEVALEAPGLGLLPPISWRHLPA